MWNTKTRKIVDFKRGIIMYVNGDALIFQGKKRASEFIQKFGDTWTISFMQNF
jgi:hypothetical protein